MDFTLKTMGFAVNLMGFLLKMMDFVKQNQQQTSPLSPTPTPPPVELSTSASSLPSSGERTSDPTTMAITGSFLRDLALAAVARHERHSRKLLETATSASSGKAVHSHLLAECEARIAALEEELSELRRRLEEVAQRGSRQECLEHDEVGRMLAVKGQEAGQLAEHKLELESQVYQAGAVTVEQQATIEAIKKKMHL